ncbi:MAG TPA: hypothetical protein VKX16_09435 [Chloroflexota bacterium]|nr:hypothetical protein [Chloroflexota bacterium]
MDSSRTDPLFSAIDALLCRARTEAAGCATRAFWQFRPHLTRAEIDMLRSLVAQPRCVEAIAALLDREPAPAQELLDALAAIGVVELRDGRYAATVSTALYCQALDQGTFLAADCS